MHDAKRYNSQANEWKVVKLGNEVDILAGFPFQSSCYTDTTESIKLVRGDNIVQGSFRWDGVKRWPKSMLEGLDSYLLREGDVVLAMDRPWIEAGLKYAAINKHDLPALLVQRTARLRGGTNLDTRFLKYVIGSRAFTQHILAMQTGTSVPHISASQIKEFSFRLPPLPTQRAIAHILGTLDDKIECNRRLNRTLEGIVRALFKSWFIDFDPVIDNALAAGNPIPDELADRAALRQQAAEEHAKPLPDDLRALFPDEFIPTDEMRPACAGTAGRWIPKGWEVAPIGDAVRCVGGSTPSTNNPIFWEGGKNPFVTPKDMATLQSPVILDTERYITDAGVAKISSKLLPIGTVILSSRAPIGYLGITAVPVSVNQGVIAMICNGDLPNLYVLQWTVENMDLIKSRAGGTTFAEINKRNFRPIPVLLPTRSVLDAFMAHAAPLHERITASVRQNGRLSALRDALLPKLLSGEVSVPLAAMPIEEDGDGGARRQLQISARHHFDLGWKDKGE